MAWEKQNPEEEDFLDGVDKVIDEQRAVLDRLVD